MIASPPAVSDEPRGSGTLIEAAAMVGVLVLVTALWAVLFVVHRRALHDAVRRAPLEFTVAGLDKQHEVDKLVYWTAGLRYHLRVRRRLDEAAAKIARHEQRG